VGVEKRPHRRLRPLDFLLFVLLQRHSDLSSTRNEKLTYSMVSYVRFKLRADKCGVDALRHHSFGAVLGPDGEA
jgi:hypothetical protein